MAMALLALLPGTASATTLAINEIPKNEPVKFTASLKSGTSMSWRTTTEALGNTCLSSTFTGTVTSPHTAARVKADVSNLTFPSCLAQPITVHKPGHIYIESIKETPGTANGTVIWEDTEITVPTPFGAVPCKTIGAADVGPLAGVGHWAATGGIKHATLYVNTLLNCSIFAPSMVFEAIYTLTSPTGLGVVP